MKHMIMSHHQNAQQNHNLLLTANKSSEKCDKVQIFAYDK